MRRLRRSPFVRAAGLVVITGVFVLDAAVGAQDSPTSAASATPPATAQERGKDTGANPFTGNFLFGDWGGFRSRLQDNPNTLKDTLEIGIGATALFSRRTLDFLQPFFTVRRERGFESFYSCAVTPWLRVTGDVQVLPATVVDRDTQVFAAVRTKVSF